MIPTKSVRFGLMCGFSTRLWGGNPQKLGLRSQPRPPGRRALAQHEEKAKEAERITSWTDAVVVHGVEAEA